MTPISRAAHHPVALRLTGPLDRRALEQSLSEIVRRHEVLRTAFPERADGPAQRVLPPEPLALGVRDLRTLGADERAARTRQIARQEAQQPFDLTARPPVRAALLRLTEREHVLLLLTHQIVFDGASEVILRRELAALYEAFASGAPSPLPELPAQYAEAAADQQQRLEGGALDREARYWQEQLADAPAALDLPTDHPRPSGPMDEVAEHTVALPAELKDRLEALSRAEEAPLFAVLLAAFQAVLGRHANETDLVVGTPVNGRSQAAWEPLIGRFANELPLRADLSGPPSFRELLGRVRETMRSAREHAALPFEQMVKAVQPKRDPSRTPLFQVLFHLREQPDAAAPLDAGALRIEPFAVDFGVGPYDLSLEVTGTSEDLRCRFTYAAVLFEPDTVERLAGHFGVLLGAATRHPDRSIAELPLLTPAERRRLAEWSDGGAAYPTDTTLHALVEAQAAATPQATALQHGDRTLTYQELNERANRLAHRLRAQGVDRGTLVGLCVERSPEMIISLLGILKAGGAYLPLDPKYPHERLQYMLEDSGAPFLVTQEHLTGAFPEHAAAVVTPGDLGDAAAEPAANPSAGAGPEDLAYVMYTSGSTGQPKGVMIEHAPAVNFVRAVADAYAISAQDRVLQFTTMSFDVSVEEIFMTLARGGAAVFRTEAMAASADAFVQFCADEALTVVGLPTAFWHEVALAMAEAGLALPSCVRLVSIGGEAARPDVLVQWQEHVGTDRPLVNKYGPTEATVWATLCPLPPHPGALRPVPIGRPIAGLRAHVLDARGQPAPVGVPGELHLGGAGLARGYLGRPERTAEAFITADPLGTAPGENASGENASGENASGENASGENASGAASKMRLYKTGDRVRWRRDGQLAFIGRLDRQVKVRGVRIEPGEIEAVLNEHPSVQEAVVVAHEHASGGTRLVAYVVENERLADEERRAAPAKVLQAYARERLPEQVVPSSFIVLGELPLTPNGKIDRGALPAPETARALSEAAFAPPRTPAEETLVRIWAEVLELEQVGIHNHFFEIGGHSLPALRVASRASRQLGASVTALMLFETPTIAGLAQRISARTAEQAAEQEDPDDLGRLLAEVEALSDEEAERLLHDETGGGA